ncbi:hypothetical protein BD289DRAFT_169346 [Coniella lustricola]|uniref:DNA (cytosine-5)-methyltransferase 1 replication foci domain-containing protein n=1 Tax=Coniella lustricola TaxID=2025994 RepID=A0A2T2ZTX5_9PEZI|nr:hypothetical protein BD289DRAFT_169346 [Coniella lustricola]
MPRPPTNRSRGPGRPRGRPRRDSNSTVASIDYARLAYLPESHVLKPAEAGVSSDLWTCFVLNDAVVYHKTPSGELEIANVCSIDLEGPYVIRGQLDADVRERDERNALLNIELADAYIEIPTSTMYAIAYPVQVWAAGKSGWFEINPAPAYQPMYQTVCEGIELYYLIQFAYEEAQEAEEASKSKKASWFNRKIEQLFLAYALKLGDGVFVEEVKERCRTHSAFLLAHFHKATDFDWTKTSFMKWMKANNQDTVERLQNAAAKLALQPPVQQAPSAVPKSTQLALRGSPIESDRSRRSKSRASRQSQEAESHLKDTVQPPRPPIQTPIYPPTPKIITPVPSPAARPVSVPAASTSHTERPQDAPTQNPSQVQEPFHLLLELLEECFDDSGGDPTKIRPSTVQSKLYMKCSMTYNMPLEIAHYFASQLVASLSSKWYTSPFFHWLKEKRDVPWKPQNITAEAVPSKLVRRKKSTSAGQPRARKSLANPLPPSAPSHAGKHYPGSPRPSGLRPTRGAKRPIFSEDYDEEGRPRKMNKLAVSPGSDDNSEDEDEDDSQQENNHKDATDLDISDAGSDVPAIGHRTALPPGHASRETMKIVVRAEKIPSMSPKGPNGTWKCEELGCKYIVRSANEPRGKELISKHFQDHENRAEKVNLALAEGNKNSLPIKYVRFFLVCPFMWYVVYVVRCCVDSSFLICRTCYGWIVSFQGRRLGAYCSLLCFPWEVRLSRVEPRTVPRRFSVCFPCISNSKDLTMRLLVLL